MFHSPLTLGRASLLAATGLMFTGMAAVGADDPRTVEVPGTSIVLKLWQAQDGGGERVPHYSISLDGATYSPAKATSYDISLRYASFDPLRDAAPAVDARLASQEDASLYIVQFVTQPLPEFRTAIEDLGGRVHWFLHRHSHIVEMDRPVRDEVEALPFVRWTGVYHPAYRLEEFLLANMDVADVAYPIHRYNIMVMDPAQKEVVAKQIAAIGGIVDRVNAGKYLVEATLTPEQLFAAARLDQVLFIDRWGPGEPDMDIARELGGANYIETEGGYTGAGVRGEILDLGFNLAHGDFASRPLIEHTFAGSDGHGASCSGICFGDGTGDPSGRGLMPSGQGIVASWFVVSTGLPRYDHTGELVQEPYHALFQTSSVGSPVTTEYTTISAETDAMLFDFDIIHCQSQSNWGGTLSRPQAWAKNIVSGGAVNHYNTESPSDDHWGSTGSTGPAADGRVKPTLCSFFDSIYTTTCCGSASYTGSFGGTSGATPIICGYVGLFFQMWADGAFGNEVDPSGTVFENRAHMTTAKAVLVNTAAQYDWTLGGPNGDISRFRQGWGRPDLKRAYDLRERMFVVDETEIITNLDTATYSVDVDAGEPALKATMVYADPPGNPGTLPHRINDLSLKVTAPDDTVYWGNNGLQSGIWSTSGGTANEVDTVENVFVENPMAGRWTVEVVASEIVQDSHVETPEIDADFSLVVSGATAAPPILIDGDVDGDGDVDFVDLIALLAVWGPCPPPPSDCPADFDGSGSVDFPDLLVLLTNWSP